MARIDLKLKELGKAFAGFSESLSEVADRLSGIKIPEKLKKEKTNKMGKTDRERTSRQVIAELFDYPAIMDQVQIDVSKAWRESVKSAGFTLRMAEDDNFYPLQAMIERSTHNYLDRYGSEAWDENDSWFDRDLTEHLDQYFDYWSDELGSSDRRDIHGGVGVVTSSDLHHFEYGWTNRGTSQTTMEMRFKVYGQLSTSDMLGAGSAKPVWDPDNRFNEMPNTYKALMITEAMHFWTYGAFLVGSQRNSFDLYPSKVIVPIQQRQDLVKKMGGLVDPNKDKLPRNLLKAIKALNPVSLSDMNGCVSFRLDESDQTYYIYDTGREDEIQSRSCYSFFVLPATFIDRSVSTEHMKNIFMRRLKAWKIIADFMMNMVVVPATPEEIELEKQQEKLEAIIAEYLTPKYSIGGMENE